MKLHDQSSFVCWVGASDTDPVPRYKMRTAPVVNKLLAVYAVFAISQIIAKKSNNR
jgi:hypothetical protein